MTPTKLPSACGYGKKKRPPVLRTPNGPKENDSIPF
nr:MAG TPA: hypothetical protein [Caudoviricetes sp.]